MKKCPTMRTELAGLEAFLSDARRRSIKAGRRVVSSFVVPAEMEFGIEFLPAISGANRFIWRSPAGLEMLGFGQATWIRFDGTDSIGRTAESARGMLDRAYTEGPNIPGTGAVLVGGFRFDNRAPRCPDWQQFPDAQLSLPRVVLTRHEGKSWLSINTVASPEVGADVEIDQAMRALDAIETGARCEAPPARLSIVSETSREKWYASVALATQAIRSGSLSKVVLSRKRRLQADNDILPSAVISRLARDYPSTTVFAMRSGENAFIGATPESLVNLDRGIMQFECMAGSAPRGDSFEQDAALEAELKASHKERFEHEAVVRGIEQSLLGLASDLERDLQPRICKLPNIQHMKTAFRARLRAGSDILDAVRALHPTPAVAGSPTPEALDLIARLEGDRGRYAAPVGWMDAKGNGQFAIGIRSALIHGPTALLFAGSGIVEGSDPAGEFAETELKFAPIQHAIADQQREQRE